MATALVQVGGDGSFQDGDVREVRSADTFSPFERRNGWTLVLELPVLSRSELADYVLPLTDARGEPIVPRKTYIDWKALVAAGQVVTAGGKVATLADVTDDKTECRTLLQPKTMLATRTAVAIP